MTIPPLIPARVGSIDIFVRAGTPDIEVAKISLGGEFDDAIAATRPLQHEFIIDAGGYIGTAAIAFALAFPRATVVTLEPSIENFAVLEANTKSYPNIVAMNVAVGASGGRKDLRNRKTGEWGFSIVESPLDRPDAEVLHAVEVTTIHALMQNFGATGIDLLKLDIEGSEHELLQPRPEWLSVTRVLIAELHDRIVPGCTTVFSSATTGRRNRRNGEKVLSVRRRAPWWPSLRELMGLT